MSLNTVALIGRVGGDPEVKYFESGSCVAKVALAVDEYHNNEKRTNWIPVEAWGKTAEVIVNFAGKGKQIGVQGSLKAESYQDKDKNNRKRVYVRASRVDLLGSKEGATSATEEEF